MSTDSKHLSECNYQRTVLSRFVVGHSKQNKRTNPGNPQMTDELRVGANTNRIQYGAYFKLLKDTNHMVDVLQKFEKH